MIKWWTSREKPSAYTHAEENILVISDVHLGEDVLTEGPEHLHEYIRVLNRELAQFVAWHRTHVKDERRWRLIINGDMFDFVKISLRPEKEEMQRMWQRDYTDEEEVKGLANTPEHTVWKLERILEIHRPLFKELSLFLLDGHAISIVEGNHDREFYFGEVRRTLTEHLVETAQRLHKRDNLPGRVDTQELRDAVSFQTWFEASAGRYHIEHGHQYDEYCCFEFNLAPYDLPESRVLATPITHRAMPYVAELLGDFSTHGVESLGVGKAAWLLASFGPRRAWLLIRLGFAFLRDNLGRVGAKRRAELREYREVHERQLKLLAEETPYGLGTLQTLDAVKVEPAEYSFSRIVGIFYLDRFMGASGMVLGALLWALIGGTTGLMCFGTLVALSFAGMSWMSHSRKRDIDEELRVAAAKIVEATGARYVVFGHSHHPEMVNVSKKYGAGRFGESSFYFNGGSWVTREILLGEKGSGGTFVEINAQGAALKRWRGLDKEPEIVACSWKG